MRNYLNGPEDAMWRAILDIALGVEWECCRTLLMLSKSLLTFSWGTRNIMLLMSMMKPIQMPSRTGFSWDFLRSIVNPASDKSLVMELHRITVSSKEEPPQMPSSRYMAHFFPSERHFLISYFINFVKMKQALLSPKGRTENWKTFIWPSMIHEKPRHFWKSACIGTLW